MDRLVHAPIAFNLFIFNIGNINFCWIIILRLKWDSVAVTPIKRIKIINIGIFRMLIHNLKRTETWIQYATRKQNILLRNFNIDPTSFNSSACLITNLGCVASWGMLVF